MRYLIAAIVLMCSTANAGYYTESAFISFQSPVGNDTVVLATVRGFDTTLGTLTSVSVQMHSDITVSGAVDSVLYPWTGAISSSVAVNSQYDITESLSDGFSASATYANEQAFQPYPFSGHNASDTLPNIYTSGSVFDTFASGVDTIFTTDFSGTLVVEGVSIYFANYVANETFTVGYTYGDVGTVPEPSSILMVSMAVVAFFAYKRTR